VSKTDLIGWRVARPFTQKASISDGHKRFRMLTVSANLITEPFDCRAGAVDSGLVRSPLDQAVWVRALTGDFPVSCCVILKLPLSVQGYKWVLVNLMLGVEWRYSSSYRIQRLAQLHDMGHLCRMQTLPSPFCFYVLCWPQVWDKSGCVFKLILSLILYDTCSMFCRLCTSQLMGHSQI